MTHASATPLPAPRRRPLRLAACAALLALLGAPFFLYLLRKGVRR